MEGDLDDTLPLRVTVIRVSAGDLLVGILDVTDGLTKLIDLFVHHTAPDRRAPSPGEDTNKSTTW